MPPKDDIAQTGPQNYKELQAQNNRPFLTKGDRKRWFKSDPDIPYNRFTSAEIKDGQFVDPKLERFFRQRMFKNKFSSLPNYKDLTQSLSFEEADDMYLKYYSADEYNLMNNNSSETDNDNLIQSEISQSNIVQDAMINRNITTPEDILAANIRYINDDNDARRIAEKDIVKQLAPNLSSYYKEFVEGNNDYIKEGDIDWDKISPIIAQHIEEDDYQGAAEYFNDYLKNIMWNNQNFGEKFVNWNGRFVANVGLMAVDLAGLFEGAGKSLFGDIVGGLLTDGNVDWNQAAASLLYDNHLANFSYDAQQYLREKLPLYNDNILLDPESVSFMASMFIPNLGAEKLLKGISTVGKEGAALSRANKINKITGYAKDLKKAQKELDDVLSDANNINNRRLKVLSQETEIQALKDGKSVAKAQEEARLVQEEALADIYHRGTIQKNQIRLSSILEGQQEALGAQKAALDEFSNKWDENIADLTTRALRGEIDTSTWGYDEADYQKHLNELWNDDTFYNGIIEHLKRSPEAVNYSDAEINHAANMYIQQYAKTQAQIDKYTALHKPEYDAKAKKEANNAGSITMLENYALLRFTEGTGGWTTRVPGFKQIAYLASQTKNLNLRVAFDKAGRAIKNIDSKVVGNIAAQYGKLYGVEIGQELSQELFASGAEGTAAHNAEEYILSHVAGPGSSMTTPAYHNYLLSAFQHAAHGRDWDDFGHIAAATALQMTLGTPSITKYKFRNKPTRSMSESDAMYNLRRFEYYMPLNSPFLQTTSQVMQMSDDAKTFIKTYNKLLDKDEKAVHYTNSSMNYAAMAFDAAANGDESSYEHSKFAARVAEATFLAQLEGDNAARITALQNLADINTRRDGESQQAFEERRLNTLQQLRNNTEYGSIKNASDEELIKFAEENGKTMIELINQVKDKTQQLYNQYDGSITWEQLYAMIYDDLASTYTKEQLDKYENGLKQAANNLKDTELTEEDIKNRILTETQIINASPIIRNNIINNAQDRQKEIVDSLLSQLKINSAQQGINQNIEDAIKKSAEEERILSNVTKEYASLFNTPKAFLSRISNARQRKATQLVFNAAQNILNELDESEDGVLSLDGRKQLSDLLVSAAVSLDRNSIDALMKAIKSLGVDKWNAFRELLNTDNIQNGAKLTTVMDSLIKNTTPNEAKFYNKVKDFIQNSHIPFDNKDAIKALFLSEVTKKTQEGITDEFYNSVNIDRFNSIVDAIVTRNNEIEEANPDIISSSTNPEDSNPRRTDEPSGQNPNDNYKPEASVKEACLRVLYEYKNNPNFTETDVFNEIEDIINQDYEDDEDLLSALITAKKDSNGLKKALLEQIVRQIGTLDTDPSTFVPERSTTFTLADINFFLNTEPYNTGAYADYMRKYNIQELVRSKKLKEGTKVYVMYDPELAKRCEADMRNKGLSFTEAYIPFVAVVEGAIDGYESVTIDGNTYTRISLFRAYGKGEHNSREISIDLVSNFINEPFVELKPFNPTSKDLQIVNKFDEPISFTLEHINEKPVKSTEGQKNSVLILSEERQQDVDNATNNKDTSKSLKERAKEWFFKHLKIDEEHTVKGQKFPQPVLELENHSARGGFNLPVHTREVSETPWNNSTVLDALINERTEVLSPTVGIPMLFRVSEFFKNFMTDKVVQKAIKDFLNGNNDALTTVDDELLNLKRGNTLAHRLSLPKNWEYFTTINTNEQTGISYLNIGFRLSNSDNDEIFISFELPATDGSTTVVTEEQVIKGLKKLILNDDNTIRKIVVREKPYELVKWNVDYDDIRHPEGIAEEILDELYNSDVFYVESDNLNYSPTEIELNAKKQIIPEDSTPKSISDDNIDADSGIETKPTRDVSPQEQEPPRKTAAETNAELLGLNVNTNKKDSPYRWEGENLILRLDILGETIDIPTKSIGITDDNKIVVYYNGEATDEIKANILTALTQLGVSNIDNVIIESTKASTDTIEESNTITPKDTNNDDSISFDTSDIINPSETPITEEDAAMNILKDYVENDLFGDLLALDIQDTDALLDNMKAKYGSYENAYKSLLQMSEEERSKELECLK